MKYPDDQLSSQKQSSRKLQDLQHGEQSQSLQQHDDSMNIPQNKDGKSKLKNQNSKRQYGCPCGKEYLSYPALFTHIKQKHGGQPPGQVKKPKTQKARGRPRLPTNMEEDNSIEQYLPSEQLRKILDGKTIQYEQQFELSSGNKTCQDVASLFLTQHRQTISQEEYKILVCFLNYMKYFTSEKYTPQYWTSNPPSQIIDISNLMVRQLEQHTDKFPLSKQILIQLLFVLFRWMYKNKFTDHKLVKRSPDNNTN